MLTKVSFVQYVRISVHATMESQLTPLPYACGLDQHVRASHNPMEQRLCSQLAFLGPPMVHVVS
jgi:hypothetical protein